MNDSHRLLAWVIADCVFWAVMVGGCLWYLE